MNDYKWYDLTEGDQLQQGDFVHACPFDHMEEDGHLLRKHYDVSTLR